MADLRRRVRAAMEEPPAAWNCPERIPAEQMDEPLAVRKARAMALKLAHMPLEVWDSQLLAGSMTLESPRIHAEWGFPDYVTNAEREAAAARGLSIRSVFGHIVPDYPRLLAAGLCGIRADAEAQRPHAQTSDEVAFLDSVVIALDAVIDYAERLAQRCGAEANRQADPGRERAAANGRQPASGACRPRADLLAGAASGVAAAYGLPCHHGWQRGGTARSVRLAPPGCRPGRRPSRHGSRCGADRLLLPEVQRTRENHRRAAARCAV